MSLIKRSGALAKLILGRNFECEPHCLENKENLWSALETWAARRGRLVGGGRLIFLIYLIQTNSIKFPYYRITRARSCGWVGDVIEQGYWGAWTHLCCVLLHWCNPRISTAAVFDLHRNKKHSQLTWARRNDVDWWWYGNLQARRLAVQDNKTYSLSIGKQVGIPLAKLIIRFLESATHNYVFYEEGKVSARKRKGAIKCQSSMGTQKNPEVIIIH